MRTYTLDEISNLIEKIGGPGVQNVGERDLTRSRYFRLRRVSQPIGNDELQLLVDTGFLKVEQRRAPGNKRRVDIYIIVGNSGLNLEEQLTLIGKQLVWLRDQDPAWLHTNDMTAERYANLHGLTVYFAKVRLEALVKDGWMSRHTVRAERRHASSVAYRLTNKALETEVLK